MFKFRSPFLSMVAEEMLARRYAKATIESYIKWIRSYIFYHDKRHPAQMGDAEVEQFLNHLFITKMSLPPHRPRH